MIDQTVIKDKLLYKIETLIGLKKKKTEASPWLL